MNLSQIRRLALANFIAHQRIVDSQEKNFSTKLNYNGNWGLYPHNWIFLIYNALSLGPITSNTEYFEQIRGMSSNIDLLRRTLDFVVGNLKLDIEFEADQENYELGNPVKVSLTLKNLTDNEIILYNPNGPTVEFIVDGYQKKTNKYIKWSTESDNTDSNRIILPPSDGTVLKWSSECLPEGVYSIVARAIFHIMISWKNSDSI